MGRSIDLNADLGEGYPTDEAVLDVVSSASIACGFHAGTPLEMLITARSAASRGVALGAHPSYFDREGFGRRDMDVPPDQLLAILAYQIGAMSSIAAAAGSALTFVKPHGGLYNRAAVDPSTAESVVEAVRLAGKGSLALLCPGGSTLAQKAESEGLPFFLESFADRAYRPDGTLLSRSEHGSVLTDPDLVAERAVRIATEGEVTACDGTVLPMKSDSICVHGDTPGAATLARTIRMALEQAGVAVRSFTAS